MFFPDFFRYFDQKSIFLTVFNGFENGNWCKMVGGIFFPPGYDPPAPQKNPKTQFFCEQKSFF